jgi:hypothetical protein
MIGPCRPTTPGKGEHTVKTSIVLAALALSLGACTAAVAPGNGDFSAAAFPRVRALTDAEIADCDRASQRFRTRSDVTSGGNDTSIAAFERDLERRLYRNCLDERRRAANDRQAP